jgi:subtilisin family serine protease
MLRFLIASWVMLLLVISALLVDATAALPASGLPLQAGPSEQAQVFIELQESPAAGALGANPTPEQLAAAQTQALALRARQSSLAPQIAALGGSELFRAQLAANGIAAVIPRGALPALRALPGVVAIHPLVSKHLAAITSVPAVGARAAWSPLGDRTGQSVRIGLADTGIDYTHVAFGGAGGTSFAANNPALIEPSSFPTSKVVGGIDLAGNSYDGGTTLPQPDADPLDCQGHGSAIASVAAGLGVTGSGQTYRGSYTSGLDLSQFAVGPGVAPGASLYAIKIFGCSGSSALAIAAIERALDPNGDGNLADRLDVLSLALVSAYGGDDVDSRAVDTATSAGLAVIAPAGNSGGSFFSVASPASARGAIAVAASEEPQLTPSGALGAIAPFSARGPARRGSLLKPDIAAPGVDIQAAASGSGSGAASFNGTSIASAHVAGAAALILEAHPEWESRQVKAALLNNARPLSTSGAGPQPPSLAGTGLLAVDRAIGGELLAFATSDAGGVSLSFGAPYVNEATWTATRSLTLANSQAYDRLLRLSSTTYTAQSGVTITPLSSTVRLPAASSVEVPVAATIDAALLSANPDAFTAASQIAGRTRHYLPEHSGAIVIEESGLTLLRLAQLADLIPVDVYIDGAPIWTNVAQGTVSQYLELAPGARRVQLFPIGAGGSGRPLIEQLVTLSAGQPVTLAITGWSAELRSIQLDDSLPAASASAGTPQLRVLSGVSSVLGALDVYVGNQIIAAGLLPARSSGYVALASAGSLEVQVRRAGAAATSRPLLSARVSISAGERIDLALGGRSAQRLSLTPISNPIRSGQELRVPFAIAPLLASNAAANVIGPIRPGAVDQLLLPLRNDGPRNVSDPLSPRLPLVSVFELGAESPDQPDTSAGRAAADLRYVGVMSDYREIGVLSRSKAYFGITSHGSWGSPNELTVRVEIDTDPVPDGIADFRLDSIDLGALQTPPQTSDTFAVALYRRVGSAYTLIDSSALLNGVQPPFGTTLGLNTNVYNTGVLFLPLALNQVTGDNPIGFRYRVQTFVREDANGEPVDQTEWLLFEPARPLFSAIKREFGLLPLHPDVAEVPITILLDRVRLQDLGSGRLLLLHHHNPPATQAELVTVLP